RLDQQLVELLAVGEALAELPGLGLQGAVREPLELRFQRVDVRDDGRERADLLALAGPEDAIEQTHGSCQVTGRPVPGIGERRRTGCVRRHEVTRGWTPSTATLRRGLRVRLSGCRAASREPCRRRLPSANAGAASRGCCARGS